MITMNYERIDMYKRRPSIETLDFYYKLFTMDFDLPPLIINIINFCNHALIVAITMGICYRCWQLKFRKTAWHAHLITIGLMLMMSEGMMVRYEGNAFYDHISYIPNLIHGCLQIIGGSMVLLGSFHKYLNRERHFNTTHARWGLYGCVFCFINIVFGICTILMPYQNSAISKIHGVWGVITYITCMWAQLTSYQTSFFRRNFIFRRAFKILTYIILFLSAFGPTKIALSRLFDDFP